MFPDKDPDDLLDNTIYRNCRRLCSCCSLSEESYSICLKEHFHLTDGMANH